MDDFVSWGLFVIIILEFVLMGLIHYLIGREVSQSYLDKKDKE